MTCRERIVELVECARRQAEPGRELRAHLSRCRSCKERLDGERQLTTQLGVMRTGAAGVQTLDLASRTLRRESLMQDFSRMHRRKPVQVWAWRLSAAAAVLVAVFLGHLAGEHPRQTASGAVRTRGARPAQAFVYEANDTLSNDASALSSDDFIAVPYTPPLAPGEMVRVVRTEMYPETLASMGVAVDPALAGDLAVDIVVGEDGLPRAVRVNENNQN